MRHHTPAGEPTAVPEDTRAKPWVARHKVLTGIGAFVVLGAIVGALGDGGDEAAGPSAEPSITATGTAVAEQTAAEREAAEEERRQEEAEAAAEATASAEAAAEAERQAEEERRQEEAAQAAEAKRLGTVAQQNAYRSAVRYLDFTAFSRKGLVEQLRYEDYSAADAEFAVARLEAEGGVDWNAQAAASAAKYLAFTSFSRAGLVEQLVYEGFTKSQATYGVSTTGL